MWLRRCVVWGWLWALCGGWVAAWAAPAQAPVCPPEPELPGRALMLKAQQQAVDRGFLWRVSRGGRDSFVYGTLHAGRADWFALGPKTEAALFRTGMLALEINATDPAELARLRAAQQGPTRSLPEPLAQDLRRAWLAACLPLEDLAQGAAEWHVMQLAVAQAQHRGLFALYSAESLLLLRSLRMQRPVMGLESAQTQLAALLARDDAEAAAWVSSALTELDSPHAAVNEARLVQAWAAGDLATLETYPAWCGCLQSASEREAFARLVDGRNPGMAAALEQAHAGVSVFAAVGALHLVGPQSLLALLQARGFVLSRVF